jgi:hypothetical protein
LEQSNKAWMEADCATELRRSFRILGVNPSACYTAPVSDSRIYDSRGFFLSAGLAGPIRRLTVAADNMSRGELDAELQETGRQNEIGDLARAIERMGIFVASGDNRSAQISFLDGIMVFALCMGQKGRKAIELIAQMGEVRFRFQKGAIPATRVVMPPVIFICFNDKKKADFLWHCPLRSSVQNE